MKTFDEKAKEFTQLTGYGIACRKVLLWLDDLPKDMDEFEHLWNCVKWERALGLDKNDHKSKRS